jgi:hypothetical protein
VLLKWSNACLSLTRVCIQTTVLTKYEASNIDSCYHLEKIYYSNEIS